METHPIEIKVLDHGFVRLVDSMGGDDSVVRSARVSYGEGTKSKHEDEALIRYLLRHEHGTPFEMTALTYHVKTPIMVARQWHRHRIGISINEVSGRYSKLPSDCYVPEIDQIRKQSKKNKQGRDELVEKPDEIQFDMRNEQAAAYSQYMSYLDRGVAREIARINLPLSIYTEYYWQCNLRSLFAFCKLRMDPHAQYEIRQYAEAMLELAKPIAPVSCRAFEDYVLGAKTFSKAEMKLIRLIVDRLVVPVETIIDRKCPGDLKASEVREFLDKLR